MIEEIAIANFRAFSKPVTVRLRPLTILIGKNSAGKSTLIKFLLMLRQTLETTEGDFLVTEGRHVTLGAFRDQQNTNREFDGKRLSFRLLVRTPYGPSAALVQLLNGIRNQLARGRGKLFSLPSTPDGERNANGETRYTIEAEVPYQRPEAGRHVVTGIGIGKKPFEIKAKSLKNVRFLSFPTNTTGTEGELEALIHNSYLRPPREVLVETRHISPVRQESQRVIALANAPEDDVGHQGEYAIQLLHRILSREGKASSFLRNHIQAIAHIDKLQFEEQGAQLLSRFLARNLDTLATCHLNDFGFGVSQCLPILVQGCLLKRGQLLIVEQPEAQLHPTAQLELGTFFADLWQQFGVPSLVETHSDNLVLRLRMLVQKKSLAPSDVSIAYFAVENRAVTVKNLDIMEDGRLQEGLPMEFFGADLLEVLEMR